MSRFRSLLQSTTCCCHGPAVGAHPTIHPPWFLGKPPASSVAPTPCRYKEQGMVYVGKAKMAEGGLSSPNAVPAASADDGCVRDAVAERAGVMCTQTGFCG